MVLTLICRRLCGIEVICEMKTLSNRMNKMRERLKTGTK